MTTYNNMIFFLFFQFSLVSFVVRNKHHNDFVVDCNTFNPDTCTQSEIDGVCEFGIRAAA